jgi:hypothetical protein
LLQKLRLIIINSDIVSILIFQIWRGDGRNFLCGVLFWNGIPDKGLTVAWEGWACAIVDQNFIMIPEIWRFWTIWKLICCNRRTTIWFSRARNLTYGGRSIPSHSINLLPRTHTLMISAPWVIGKSTRMIRGFDQNSIFIFGVFRRSFVS